VQRDFSKQLKINPMSKFETRAYRKITKIKRIFMLIVASLGLIYSITSIYYGRNVIQQSYPTLTMIGRIFILLCCIDIAYFVIKWSYQFLLNYKSQNHYHCGISSSAYKRVNGELEPIGEVSFEFYHDISSKRVLNEIVAVYIWNKAEDASSIDEINSQDLVDFINITTDYVAAMSSSEISTYQRIMFRKNRWFR
jgi:hypothetical protein